MDSKWEEQYIERRVRKLLAEGLSDFEIVRTVSAVANVTKIQEEIKKQRLAK